MFPLSSKQKGNMLAFPDTCKTPTPVGPVPVPYPNMGMLMQANPGTMSKKVKINNFPAAHIKTVIPMSTGDEAGVAGGVVSGKIKGQIKYTTGSSKVTIEGKKAVYLLCMTAHNGAPDNAKGGAQLTPSQNKVVTLQ